MNQIDQFDSKASGREARIGPLLDDLLQAHIASRTGVKIVIAVWYRKRLGSDQQSLLELIDHPEFKGFHEDQISLHWKTGFDTPPHAHVRTTSVAYFLELVSGHPAEVSQYYDRDFEVLYFEKNLSRKNAADAKILEIFHVVTEPPGLMKGWYVSDLEFDQSHSPQDLLSRRDGGKPELGLAKVFESEDLTHCRGILHIQIAGKWVPFSAEGIRAYAYYADVQSGRRAYFLFEGGATYEILRFEVKTAPDYLAKFGLTEKALDDRYPEVYLRAVRPPARNPA